MPSGGAQACLCPRGCPQQRVKQRQVCHCHPTRRHQFFHAPSCTPLLFLGAKRWRGLLEGCPQAVAEPQAQLPCRKLSRLSMLLNDLFLARYCTVLHTTASLYPAEIFCMQRQAWDHSPDQIFRVKHRLPARRYGRQWGGRRAPCPALALSMS